MPVKTLKDERRASENATLVGSKERETQGRTPREGGRKTKNTGEEERENKQHSLANSDGGKKRGG
jgi:hypothetical protein